MKKLAVLNFLVIVLTATVACMVALYTVFGPVILAAWGLSMAAQALVIFGLNPNYTHLNKVLAATCGLNVGLAVLSVVALSVTVGWWTLVGLAVLTVSSYLFHYIGTREPTFDPAYGATIEWVPAK